MSEETVSQRRLLSNRTVAYGNKDLVDAIMQGYMLGDRVITPNIFDLCNHLDLREYYLAVYDYELSQFGESPEGVSETLRLVQGMAFDGEFIGYNKKTGEAKLYSGKAKRIKQLTGREFNLVKTEEKNKRGVIHCMRLDVSYETESQFTVKAVNLNVKTELVLEDTIFIPFWVIPSMIRVLYSLLRAAPAVELAQSYGHSLKTRYVSGKAKVIRKYTDDLLKNVPKPMSFPLYFQVYLPVLGAPSSTVGLTRVDLLSLERIKSVSPKDWESLPIAPVNPNPLSSLLQEQVASVYIDSLFIPEISSKTQSFKNRVLNTMNSFGLNVTPESGRFELIKKMHEFSAEQNMIFWKQAVPTDFHTYLLRVSQLLNNYEVVEFASEREFRAALYDGVYLVNSLTKGGKFSKAIVTNSKDILRAAYGENYVARYESKRVKEELAVQLLQEGASWEDVERLSGISFEVTEDLEDLLSKVQQDAENYRGPTGSADTINCRALFQLSGSPMYFRKIPFQRIFNVIKLTK